MRATAITYMGQQVVLACDERCEKAWGVQLRPRHYSSVPGDDDYEFLSDDELGTAPADPGTYEGGYGKPTQVHERHNKWCARQCERSCIGHTASSETLPTFSRRLPNRPSGADATEVGK